MVVRRAWGTATCARFNPRFSGPSFDAQICTRHGVKSCGDNYVQEPAPWTLSWNLRVCSSCCWKWTQASSSTFVSPWFRERLFWESRTSCGLREHGVGGLPGPPWPEPNPCSDGGGPSCQVGGRPWTHTARTHHPPSAGTVPGKKLKC